jgi:3-methyladenine DNA glycosylase AlkD
MPADLVEEIRAALRAVADPVRAPAMQAYMKSEMPFLGVQKPQRTQVLRPILRQNAPARQWRRAARRLWDEAAFREERYAALAILRAHDPAPPEALLRHLVVTGAWWDLVDEVATQLLDPRRIDVRPWAVDEDLWIRRAAIICQVGRRRTVDPELLTDVITANLGDRTFWITKAIGWALRDYAYQNPAWVGAFVATHDLAPLSRREATKHLH